jgi:lysophospholipase L1-like esterase
MNPLTYLDPVLDELQKQWPGNRTVNVVCHGHSVPSGYFATPFVDTFSAYPHLLHRMIKERFPFAVCNVIVTAIGGENSEQGARRFEAEVLCHRPDVLTLDYALNDRRIGLDAAKAAWSGMIERALAKGSKVILLTPSWEKSYLLQNENWDLAQAHAAQVRELAAAYQIGLADTFARFEARVQCPEDLPALLSHVNHPSKAGHAIIADELATFFMAR